MNDNNQESKQSGMHIDVEHLSVTGHVVFAGRDGSVSVNTGGDVDQQSTQTITIGGVETTQQALESMQAKLKSLTQSIENESFDDETKDDALHDLKTVEEQLTASNKPNSRILTKAARALYRLSPVLATGVISLFGDPLVTQIVAGAGGIAVQFLDAISRRHSATKK